jgi:hypothetical protein
MEAALWTAIGLVAATSIGTLFWAGTRFDALADRIDALGATTNQRFDALGQRFDVQAARIDDRFDAVDARLDAFAARLDSHLDRHAS